MTHRIPTVSIGLPVCNGEQFLVEAINSLLAQTYTDFELIISDNASTDRTGEICTSFQASDPRIRYYRQKTNVGGGNNANFTFKVANGKYFCWAAHDDIYAPRFLEKSVAVLDSAPDVVLSHTIVAEIDEHGNTLRLIDRETAAFKNPSDRFRSLASFGHNCEDSCGLIRSDVLRKTRLNVNYTDSDRTLLVELGLRGRFRQVPEPLFFKRTHSGMSTKAFADWHERMAWFNPDLRGKIVFPNWLQFFHYLQSVWEAPISVSEKLKCYQHIPHWLIDEWHGGMMLRDIKIALKKALGIDSSLD